jgi:hypothetical protein
MSDKQTDAGGFGKAERDAILARIPKKDREELQRILADDRLHRVALEIWKYKNAGQQRLPEQVRKEFEPPRGPGRPPDRDRMALILRLRALYWRVHAHKSKIKVATGSAAADLDALTRKYHKAKPNLSRSQAFARVYTDPANRHLVVKEKQERLARGLTHPETGRALVGVTRDNYDDAFRGDFFRLCEIVSGVIGLPVGDALGEYLRDLSADRRRRPTRGVNASARRKRPPKRAK